MSAARLARPDLRVWLAGGALALALHASFALRLVQWHDPIPGDNGSEAVLIDLAPLMQEPQTPTQEDSRPGRCSRKRPPRPSRRRKSRSNRSKKTSSRCRRSRMPKPCCPSGRRSRS